MNESTRATFRGQTVLLTGASGGLGGSFALELTECGVSKLILSARKLDALQAVADECRAIKGSIQVECITCDLADPASVDSLCQQVSSRAVDVLINNGGVSSRSRFIDTSADVDRMVMQVNFLSGAALAKAVVPGMMARNSGRIIWISSVQGLLGIPNRSSYAASKFAVQGYCESIRGELASSGIAVHCASPGYIRTNLSQSAVVGDGSRYGQTDPTTEAGADPVDVAREILTAAAKGKADFTVASSLSATVAIWLRLLCPALLRSMLVKRYEKSQKLKND